MHYKLTDEYIVNIFGVKLFRIELTIDCKWGKAGDKGGFIEKESNLSNAWVSGNAQVYGDAWVSGDAQVSGDAKVFGNAWVSGNAQVYGDAQVSGNAQVYGDSRVFGNAKVYGDSRVFGDAQVSGNAWVSGNAQVYGDAWVSGDAQVFGDAQVSGNAWSKSPLQIQGTKHFVNICAKGVLKIGCKKLSLQEWKDNFQSIGKSQGYSDDEILEYGMYIDLAIKLNN